jgi:diadenosine tetraphosphate (Ap4A) HIT family hydrolase
VPETPEQFWERARAGLQSPPVEEWDSWPFQGPAVPRELEPPVDKEPPRHGVGGADCWHCKPTNVVWSDENWVLRSLDKPSGLPLVVLLETKRHLDFPELDDELAAELGPLLVRIHRAVADVPGVGRVHIGRWGEGSEHLHIWFLGRTARMMQLRSSFAEIWDDVLPPTPEDVWRENLELVRAALEGEGGGP